MVAGAIAACISTGSYDLFALLSISFHFTSLPFPIYPILSVVALYPLDLIKVRMQTYDGRGHRYSSLLYAFRSIINNEGFFALYKVNYHLGFMNYKYLIFLLWG